MTDPQAPLPKYKVIGHQVVTPTGVVTRSQLINRERQLGKQFRAEHMGANGRPLSGRQFRMARKRGQREARTSLPIQTPLRGDDVATAA